jgi:hypothetical protein
VEVVEGEDRDEAKATKNASEALELLRAYAADGEDEDANIGRII